MDFRQMQFTRTRGGLLKPRRELYVPGGGGDPEHEHEPPGFTQFTDIPFSEENETTWLLDNEWSMRHSFGTEWLNFNIRNWNTWTPTSVDTGGNPVSISKPAAPPISPPYIGEFKFDAGFGAGSGPTFVEKDYPGNYKSIYHCFWWALSSNWWGNDAGVNKILYMNSRTSDQYVLNAKVVDAGSPITIQIRTQNCYGHSGIVDGNWNTGEGNAADMVLSAPDSIITRGQWHKVELLNVLESAFQAFDGRHHVWLDGVHVLGDDTVAWFGTDPGSGNFYWDRLTVNPVYGGAGEDVPWTQYHWWDQCYGSGMTGRYTGAV